MTGRVYRRLEGDILRLATNNMLILLLWILYSLNVELAKLK